MPDDPHPVDVSAWVERAAHDPVAYRKRQVVEIILNAIALTAPLNSKMYLKGGILLGLAYGSPRQTMDVDLTTTFPPSADINQFIRSLLSATFPRAAAKLGYADLVVRAQSVKHLPRRSNFTTARAPALKLRIAYATRGSVDETKLDQGRSSNVVDVDISFNEPSNRVQVLRLTGGEELHSYGLIDLVAEKYRALLQQKSRNRNRRQDVYDLHMLIHDGHLDNVSPAEVLEVLVEKCIARGIRPNFDSLDDTEIQERAHRDWDSMELELEELPEFKACYKTVRAFYRSLPWHEA